MIILKDVAFEQQAQFLQDNVCDYPQAAAFETADRGLGGVLEGIKAHLGLLKAIYGDVAAVEGKDDKARYANLIATVDFLYTIFAYGTLWSGPEGTTVRIDKDTLNEAYKKGSLGRRKRHLEHHGFSVRYLADGQVSRSLSQATHVSAGYEHNPTLAPALKRFAERTAALPDGGAKAACSPFATFLKGDYAAAFSGKPVPRDGLDPLRADILRTVGRHRSEWISLVNALSGRCGLVTSGFLHYGASPSWSISFSEGRKKPLAIFTLGSNLVFIEFTLPIEAAEAIILARRSCADGIREKIESFHCVQCPKDCKGANLTKIDGIWLCCGRAEARRIYTALSATEDFASIHAILDIIYGSAGSGLERTR